MPPHKSRSASISFVEGQQNGAGVAPPLRLLLRGRARLCLVLLWSLRGLCGGRFPANVPPSPQRPSEAKAWPHPSALPPLALGKPASPRTVHWLAPCIARWFAQRRARRCNAYSVGYADLVCFCEAWSLRGIVHSGSAFCLSRQRHGAGINQMRLHRHATAAVCGSCASTKKPCRTKPPAPAFSLPHTTLRVRLGRCAFCLFIPAPLQGASALACADRSTGSPQCGSKPLSHPSLSGCAGSRCAARFRLTCHASHPPPGAP